MITVLTPTFDRAHTLQRLFDSLISQSNKRFEWVVVDDGSTDHTDQLLSRFALDGRVNMVVIKQVNAGKHLAVNSGVRAASGDWIFIVDSDDVLIPEAISKVYYGIDRAGDSSLSGLCFRRGGLDGSVLGVVVSDEMSEFAYMHTTEASHFYRGDLAYVFKRQALLDHPFPSFEKENFVPELLVWNEIADAGKIACFHRDIIYLCEYLADGYTNNFSANLRRNPKGFGAFYRQQLFREHAVIRKLKNAARFLQCVYYAKKRTWRN